MKTKILAAISALAFAGSVSAIPVTGTIQMTGNVTFDTDDLETATLAKFPQAPFDAMVTSGTGSYAETGVANAPVVWQDFTFGATGPQDVTPLWTFVNLLKGWTYSFSLESISSITRSSDPIFGDELSIKGLGKVSITGPGSTFDTTVANWTFNVTDSSGGGQVFEFAFNDSNTAIPSPVPDGGASLVLLGTAFAAISAIRRKVA